MTGEFISIGFIPDIIDIESDSSPFPIWFVPFILNEYLFPGINDVIKYEDNIGDISISDSELLFVISVIVIIYFKRGRFEFVDKGSHVIFTLSGYIVFNVVESNCKFVTWSGNSDKKTEISFP